MPEPIVLEVNGRVVQVEVEPDTPLLLVLRNDLGLTAAKFGCGLEQCGACKVIVDGEAVYSCREPVEAFAGRRITTLEGIGTADDLHPLQRSFLDEQAAQCGYCIPGHILNTVALLSENPKPSEEQVLRWANRNLCRCCAYPNILSAVRRAAGLNQKTASGEGR